MIRGLKAVTRRSTLYKVVVFFFFFTMGHTYAEVGIVSSFFCCVLTSYHTNDFDNGELARSYSDDTLCIQRETRRRIGGRWEPCIRLE